MHEPRRASTTPHKLWRSRSLCSSMCERDMAIGLQPSMQSLLCQGALEMYLHGHAGAAHTCPPEPYHHNRTSNHMPAQLQVGQQHQSCTAQARLACTPRAGFAATERLCCVRVHPGRQAVPSGEASGQLLV